MAPPKDDTQFEGTQTSAKADDLAVSTTTPVLVHIIPQAHIDLAWQWTALDAVEMVLETFRAHARLLGENDARTFAQSQLAAYAIVEREDPELFQRIKSLIARGQWEVVGGEWVEPDRSLPGGEALVRQLYEGQTYAREKLGTQATTSWCPDSFTAHPRNLPQLLRQAGLEFHVIKRPREKYTSLPLVPFHWRGLDGTAIVTYRSNNKGRGLPALSEGTPAPPEGSSDLAVHAEAFEKIGLSHLWGPRGVGDTGGVNEYPEPASGPGWESRYSTPSKFIAALKEWNGFDKLPERLHEIGPVVMPGCLTTHAEMKSLNRQAENVLQSAETVASITQITGGDADTAPLTDAWRATLFNQFHDAVTGVGIHDMHVEAEHSYREAVRVAEQTRHTAARSLARRVSQPDGPAVLVINDLGWRRTDVVETEVDLMPRASDSDMPELWEAVAPNGKSTPVVVHGVKRAQSWKRHRISFVAKDLPAMGWRVYTLRPVERMQALVRRSGADILNGHLTARMNPTTGCMEALINRTDAVQIDTELARPKLHEEGNYFLDYGFEHRAWYLGLSGKQKPVEFVGLRAVTDHPGCQSMESIHRFGDSELRQEFIVRHDLEHVEVRVRIDWHEIEHLLRLHFQLPLVNEGTATYDSAYGVTERQPDGRETAMQTFCDLSDGRVGLGILNDGKYGATADGNELMFSAVRCSTFPDPRSDEGIVEFRYAMVPHSGSWEHSDMLRRGYAFNRPPVAIPIDGATADQGGSEAEIEPEGELVTTDGSLLPVLMKPARNGNGWALRLFHATAREGAAAVQLHHGLAKRATATILEDVVEEEERPLRPFEVTTWMVDRQNR